MVVLVVVVVACESLLRISCGIMCPRTLKLDSVEHLPKVEQVGSVKVALLLAQLNHVHSPLGHVAVQCDLVPLEMECLDA